MFEAWKRRSWAPPSVGSQWRLDFCQFLSTLGIFLLILKLVHCLVFQVQWSTSSATSTTWVPQVQLWPGLSESCPCGGSWTLCAVARLSLLTPRCWQGFFPRRWQNFQSLVTLNISMPSKMEIGDGGIIWQEYVSWSFVSGGISIWFNLKISAALTQKWPPGSQ